MKFWNSAFNAQGSRVTIVTVAAVKIYVAAVHAGAQEKMERQDETPFTTKIGGKTSLGPSKIELCVATHLLPMMINFYLFFSYVFIQFLIIHHYL
jgi:hypothetical protein